MPMETSARATSAQRELTAAWPRSKASSVLVSPPAMTATESQRIERDAAYRRSTPKTAYAERATGRCGG